MIPKLTGRVFKKNIQTDNEGTPSFQLEAQVDGVFTRLQAEGELPETCLFDRRHSGLQITEVLDSFPPQYMVRCSCGYNTIMRDPNYFFDKIN
jgi:hypothetical protein